MRLSARSRPALSEVLQGWGFEIFDVTASSKRDLVLADGSRNKTCRQNGGP